MPLRRLTIATEAMDDFIELPKGQQKVLAFLMARRNFRLRPQYPTNYFSYAQIAEETKLTDTSVRVVLSRLKNEKWIAELSRRKRDGILEYKWTFPRLDNAIITTYAEEALAKQEKAASEQTEKGEKLIEGYIWRIGGLGYQRKSLVGNVWADFSNPSDVVKKAFEGE